MSELLKEFTNNRFPRGFGFPKRCNSFKEYFIPNSIKDLQDFITQFNETNCYITVYSFGKYDQTCRISSTAIIDTIVLDFDDENNPENSLQDLKKLLGWAKKHSIFPRIQYSGNKGFHAFLDFEPVVLEHPQDTLREFVRKLQASGEFSTLDFSVVGDYERLIRLPNTRHGKTGRFCYPLDPEIVPNLSIDTITKLAQFRSDFIPVRVPNRSIRTALLELDEEVDQNIRARRRRSLAKKAKEQNCVLKDLYKPLPCKAFNFYLKKGAAQGTRNNAICGIIHYCRRSSYSLEETYKTLQDFGEKCDPPVADFDLKKQLKYHWEKTYSHCTFFTKISPKCDKCAGRKF